MPVLSTKKNTRPRLTGVSEQLWQYDTRRSRGWRLDTNQHVSFPRHQARDKGQPRPTRQLARFTHYIGAGGLRHAARDRAARRLLTNGQTRVWQLFAAFVLMWLVCRWL